MAVSIGDVSSAYTDYYNNSSTTTDSIANMDKDNMSTATDQELMDACKEFEAYFIEQMYKSMEKTVMKSDDEEENPYMSNFGDMLTEEYAKSATEGEGIGIAKVLYEQMKRNYSL